MEPQGKKKLAWVQNDLFCECGYNLFAQPVQVDERLGFPVSRCPECGKFHAMTTTFASLSTWRTRQEQAVILSVTLALLIVLGLATLGLWGMQVGYMELDREINLYVQRHSYVMQTPNGIVYQNPNPSGQNTLYWMMQLYRPACMLAGLIFVTMAMTFFWHWNKRMYYLLLLIPAIACGMTVWLVTLDNQATPIEYRSDESGLVMGAFFEMIGMVAAIWLGRRIVRGLIRTFVPPKWRTPFKHLWLVDGLQLPKIEFTNPIEYAAPGPPEMRVVEGPPESKVPEARKGLDTATDVISRMMSGEKKSDEQPPQ